MLFCFLSLVFAIQGPEPALPTSESAEKVLVLPIHDEDNYMVDQVQADFIIDALEKAENEHYRAVILTIDTYGGIVHSAREINEKLLRMTIPTYAYVEKKAISAGTFIAFGCDTIAMEKMTTMGDAQVIMQTEKGIEEAPEKIVTVYRSDWKKACDAKGHPFALVQGFFDKDAEILWVGDDQQKEFMLREDYDALPEAQRKPILRVVSKAGQLLTLHANEAAELGLTKVYDNFDAFLADINIRPESVVHLNMEWNQKILRFLGANSWIFVILTLIGLNGIYTELKAPGFGIAGFTAIVCFAIVFGSRFILGTASSFEIVMFILGVVLCAVEIFVLPGLGVVGVTGLIMIFGSLVLSFMPDFGPGPVPTVPQFDLQWQILGNGMVSVFIAFVLSIVTFAFVFPMFLKIPFVQARIMGPVQAPEAGYVFDTVENESELIGQVAQVEGGLRPSGKVRLQDGTLMDVVSRRFYH
ncbi:MAG: hypothetical protein H6510_01570 [Acidobacteria bacterium]|nr:hypothetical protein [Acidobacteriota bacterium]